MTDRSGQTTASADAELDSVAAWLSSLIPSKPLSASGRQLLNQLASNPGKASYSTAAELAELGTASVSSVTRLAQRLGFEGWPDLQRGIRARYLAHLSLLEVADAHEGSDTPFQTSIRKDAAALATALRNVDEPQIERVAGILATAVNIYVTAQGSFSAVGQSMVHNIRIAGYPARDLLDNPVSMSNIVAQIGANDVLVVCSYWRLYHAAVIAASAAHSRGAKVIVIADNISPALYKSSDEVILVTAESNSFFPSLTAAMSVQQGIVATLARLDSERTRMNLVAVENSWQEFNLLHRSVPRIPLGT